MPPQKNTGTKGAKRETPASMKNKRFIQNLFDDLKAEGGVDDVHIARVLRRLGDGRMEVFYAKKVGETDEQRGNVAQAVIRGSFRGKGKHSVWIDVGSFVAVAETGVSGSSALEIVAVLTSEQMRDLSKHTKIDPRVLAVGATDGAQLLASKMSALASDEPAFEFTNAQDDDSDVDIDDI